MNTHTHRPGHFSTQFRATPTFKPSGCRGTNCESKNATPLAQRGRGVLTDYGGGAGVGMRVLGIRTPPCFPQGKNKGPPVKDLFLRESGVLRERSGADTTHQTASMCAGAADRGGGAQGGGGSGRAGAVLPHLQSEL